jgi:hypothetical protein
MDEVDFTILAATSVFTDLVEKCPPAEACRDAFDRTAKTTLKMATANGGFGVKQVAPVVNATAKRGPSRTYTDRHQLDYFSTTSTPARGQIRSTADPRSTTAARYGATADVDTRRPHAGSSHAPDPTSFQLSMPGVAVKSEPEVFTTIPQQSSSNDNILLQSPTAMPVQSPVSVTSLTPGSAPLQVGTGAGTLASINFMQSPTGSYTPGAMSYSDLQGRDMMQGVQQGANGGGSDVADFGLGLGWEGIHHDYNDGTQIDLFEGFFFGGQQGNGGS